MPHHDFSTELEPRYLDLQVLSPQDGFRAETHESSRHRSLEVRVSLRSDNEVDFSHCLWRTFDTGLAGYGEQQRVFALAKAISHYFNSGGSASLLLGMVSELAMNEDLPEIQLPPNMFLFATGPQSEPPWWHIYGYRDSDKMHVLVEDYVSRESSAVELRDCLNQLLCEGNLIELPEVPRIRQDTEEAVAI